MAKRRTQNADVTRLYLSEVTAYLYSDTRS